MPPHVRQVIVSTIVRRQLAPIVPINTTVKIDFKTLPAASKLDSNLPAERSEGISDQRAGTNGADAAGYRSILGLFR